MRNVKLQDLLGITVQCLFYPRKIVWINLFFEEMNLMTNLFWENQEGSSVRRQFVKNSKVVSTPSFSPEKCFVSES